MNCSEARKILYPAPEQALVTIETVAATDHVRNCGDCTSFFEEQRRVSANLRTKARDEAAPEALRERIAHLVEQHRTEATSRPRKMFPAVAAIVLAAGLGAVWFVWNAPSRQLFQEMCQDHAKYLDAQSQLPSSDPSAIELWFRDKAEFRVHVPTLEKTDLLGSRLCFLKQRKAALIFYRKDTRPVSLFELSRSDVSLAYLDRSMIDGRPIWHKSFNGYSVVAFENRGVVNVLVSDLREDELLPLALAARRG